jgi:hypothetical protein
MPEPLSAKKSPPQTPVRSSAAIAQDLTVVEQRHAFNVRERNTRHAELNAALTQGADDQLSDARALRVTIKKLDDEVALLDDQRRALTVAADEARRRDAAAQWIVARKASEAAADKVRQAVQRYQQAVDALLPLGDAVMIEEAKWVDTLAPANAPRPPTLLCMILNRLTSMRLHILTGGRLRATGTLLESCYEMQQAGRADFMRHTENILVPAMRAYDAAPPGAVPPPPKAA